MTAMIVIGCSKLERIYLIFGSCIWRRELIFFLSAFTEFQMENISMISAYIYMS